MSLKCLSPLFAVPEYDEDGLLKQFKKFCAPDVVGAVPVPCGRCLACKNKQNKEKIFIGSCALYMNELNNSYGGRSCFITLTYNNDYLPPFGGLNYKDLSRFIKSLKEYARKNNLPPVQYIYCGEYGLKGCRPHFHLILFGVNSQDLKTCCGASSGFKESSAIVGRFWRFGFNTCLPVSVGSIKYVAGYVCKKIISDPQYYNNVAVSTRARLIASVGSFNRLITPGSTRALSMLPYFGGSIENLNNYIKENNKLVRDQSTIYINDRAFSVPSAPVGRCLNIAVDGADPVYINIEKVRSSAGLGFDYFYKHLDNYLNSRSASCFSPLDCSSYKLPLKFLNKIKIIAPDRYLIIKKKLQSFFKKDLSQDMQAMDQAGRISKLYARYGSGCDCLNDLNDADQAAILSAPLSDQEYLDLMRSTCAMD